MSLLVNLPLSAIGDENFVIRTVGDKVYVDLVNDDVREKALRMEHERLGQEYDMLLSEETLLYDFQREELDDLREERLERYFTRAAYDVSVQHVQERHAKSLRLLRAQMLCVSDRLSEIERILQVR